MADASAQPFIAGKPLNIRVPCAGLAAGTPVKIQIFEPTGLGGDPIETIQAKVDPEGGFAEASWTYDYAKYKDKTNGSTFLVLVQGAGRTTISQPLEFVALFDAKVQDADGHPAANRQVILHANRGEDIESLTDGTGRVRALVPPGDYHVELRGEVPPDERIPPHDPAEAAALAAETAALAAAAAAAGQPGGLTGLADGGTTGTEAQKAAEAAADLAAHPARSIPGAVFAFDSAFPGPGIFAHLQQIEDAAAQHPEARLVVFGHADPKGSDDYNKGLTDRRAKAVLALLTDDLALFEQVSQHDQWATKHYQAMLRGVGCNPGAIDGATGPLLEEALRAFQQEYNANVYHDGERPRAHGDLVVNGQLDDPTKAAIRDAYVVGTPGSVDEGRFAGPKFAGCSKFNLISKDDALDRRVIVALFGQDGPADSDFPCKEGKVSACTVDAQAPMRCTFYRKVVKEEDRGDYPPFFDHLWLKRKDGRVELSALTTLPEGTACTFTIFKCTDGALTPPPESSTTEERPTPGDALGELEGKIEAGVAFAIWTPPDGFDPFDDEKWLVDHDVSIEVFQDHSEPPEGSDASIEGLLQKTAMQPPVFVIDAGEHWAFSRPPGKRLDRVRFVNQPDAQGRALSSDGGVVTFAARNSRARSKTPFDVLSLAVVERKVESDEADDSGQGGNG